MFAPALLAVSILMTASQQWIPDSAPYGPQRPYEPDVAGPRNLDRLDVTVTRNPSPAQSTTATQTASTSQGVTAVPDASTNQGVTIKFDRRSRTAEGTVPAAARRFVFLFDPAISFNLRDFPTCAAALVREQGPAACPSGSQVGGGTSTDIQGRTTPVYLLNTRHATGDYGLLVSIPAANVLLEQTLERVSLPYRGTYRWALDEIVPPTSTPPQDRAGTSRFELTFGATRTINSPTGPRTVSLVQSSAPNHPPPPLRPVEPLRHRPNSPPHRHHNNHQLTFATMPKCRIPC